MHHKPQQQRLSVRCVPWHDHVDIPNMVQERTHVDLTQELDVKKCAVLTCSKIRNVTTERLGRAGALPTG